MTGGILLEPGFKSRDPAHQGLGGLPLTGELLDAALARSPRVADTAERSGHAQEVTDSDSTSEPLDPILALSPSAAA